MPAKISSIICYYKSPLTNLPELKFGLAGVSTHMCLNNSEYKEVNVDPALTVSQLFANAGLTAMLGKNPGFYGYSFYFMKHEMLVKDEAGKHLEVTCLKLTDNVSKVFKMLITHAGKIDSVSVLPTICWQ